MTKRQAREQDRRWAQLRSGKGSTLRMVQWTIHNRPAPKFADTSRGRRAEGRRKRHAYHNRRRYYRKNPIRVASTEFRVMEYGEWIEVGSLPHDDQVDANVSPKHSSGEAR